MKLEATFAMQRAIEAEALASNVGRGFSTPELEPMLRHGLRFETSRDPVMGMTVTATMSSIRESLTWNDVAMAMAGGNISRRLGAFIDSLPNRSRANYARPAEPWPDCLPPLLGPSYNIDDAFDGDGLPPMFPTLETP